MTEMDEPASPLAPSEMTPSPVASMPISRFASRAIVDLSAVFITGMPKTSCGLNLGGTPTCALMLMGIDTLAEPSNLPVKASLKPSESAALPAC